MKMMIRIGLVVMVVALTGLCFAPIEDKPSGSEFHRELNQSELGRYQGSSGVAKTPDAAPRLDETPVVQKSQDSKRAAEILASGNPENAEKSLTQAKVDQVTPAKKGGLNMILAGVLVMIGLISAYGIRMYLDRSVPEMSVKKRS
ncbi:hypothetical protein CCB80_04040 [Armatimonadetes bacterium Uphvl-Ar1]|nr:hypothetical protein CCB80_04040 [Armatimonadetes bacterium Uphvl-Ar1]